MNCITRFPHALGRATVLIGACLAVADHASATSYITRNLTSNICCVEPNTDRRLSRAWGVAFDPAGAAWVAAPFSARAELFDGVGATQPLSVRMEVPPLFNGGFVTGLAFNPGDGFLVPNGTETPSPARFLFVTFEGTILGWAPRPVPTRQNTLAPIMVNNFARGDFYTGAALAHTPGGDRLLIADLGHGRIEVVDSEFNEKDSTYIDPGLPPGFAPFNVRVLGDRVLVAYARQNQAVDPGNPFPSNGIISTFSLEGGFQSRLITNGALNAPWGMAMAPADFGPFGNALLVANVGDGRINAFNVDTGAFLGTLSNAAGTPIFIDGLHGIDFGNNQPTQPTNTLYYTASPSFGVVGIFGRIDLSCRLDFNSDGGVNTGDLAVLLGKFGQVTSPSDPIDVNADGLVNTADIAAFLGSFGQSCP